MSAEEIDGPVAEILPGAKAMRISKLLLKRLPSHYLFASLAILGGAGTTFGVNAQSDAPSAPSKQMREQMAAMHEQMAACLRSDKPIAECRSEMMKSCQKMMGGQGCSMSGMGMGKGMGDHMTPKQNDQR